MKRTIKWIVTNAAAAAFLWFAIKGSQGAQNVVLITVWMFSVIQILVALATDKEGLFKSGPPVPLEVIAAYDAAYFVALAWLGWNWSAAVYALSSLLLSGKYLAAAQDAKAERGGL